MPLINRETPWQRHKRQWENCKLCPLWSTRRKVVLTRGTLPADVLFIGEAPGVSEDLLGSPFIGPAGKLLDQMIDDALKSTDHEHVKLAFTNLIACIPYEEDIDTGGFQKAGEPPYDSIRACAPRVVDFVGIAKPRTIIMVGSHAEGWVPKLLKGTQFDDIPRVSIVHPASILRMTGVRRMQQGLVAQRCIITLSDAIVEL